MGTKISALPLGTTPMGAEIIPAVQGGQTVGLTAQQLIRGGLTNARLAKTALYTVANADKGMTIALSGNALYTLTFNAASGYDANFAVLVVNEDGWTSGRAKKIALNGGATTFLWPGQSVEIYSQNGAWLRFPDYQRAALPSAGITINTDFTNGDDANSDGLGTGTGAWKSVHGAMFNCLQFFDWRAISSNPGVLILMAAGSTDTVSVHFSAHTFVGAQGSNAFRLDGNGATIHPTSGAAMEFFYGSVVRIRNITIAADLGHGISSFHGAKVYIEDLVTFNKAGGGGSDINCKNAYIEFGNDVAFSGSTRTSLINNDGGRIGTGASITFNITADQNYTATIIGSFPGTTDFNAVTWDIHAHTITATNKYNLQGLHVLTNGAATPGSGAGSAATGSQVL